MKVVLFVVVSARAFEITLTRFQSHSWRSGLGRLFWAPNALLRALWAY